MNQQNRLATLKLTKRFIWLYLILLLTEGGIRKWFLPGLSDPLLIIRDPVALAIYVLALQLKAFPFNKFLSVSIVLGVMCGALAILAHGNPIVAAYGVRINFFHIPLIFVMGRVLNMKDVIQIGRFLLIVSIGMTVIMVLQFYSSPNSFINRAPGGIEGEGIMGAKGRFRPPGTFSFITGIASFYPLVVAFLSFSYLRYKILKNLWLLVITGSALTAMFVSISRLTFLSCVLVAAAAVFTMLFVKIHSKRIGTILMVAMVMTLVLPYFGFFNEGVDTFEERWDRATDTQDGKVTGISGRFFDSFLIVRFAYAEAPLLGGGIGAGSNVGAKFLNQSKNFTMGEGEWQKSVNELGPILGTAFLLYRIALFLTILTAAFRALTKQKNQLPMLLFAATGILLLNGQWGQPTILGFSAFGAGLVLAACNVPKRKKILRKRTTPKTPPSEPQSEQRATQKPLPPPPPKGGPKKPLINLSDK